MSALEILPRGEVAAENTWDLSVLFPSDEAWLAEYESLRALPERYASWQGRLGESAETLLAWFRFEDEVSLRIEKFYGYASCKGDEDTSDSRYQDFRGKAIGVLVALESASAFATPELMALEESTLDSFFAACPELETYRRPLQQIRRKKAHTLSAECETLLAAAGELGTTPDNISGILQDADLTFPDVTDAQGKTHVLTGSTLVPLLMSEDRTLRKNAFEACYGRYGEFKNTCAAILDAQFKQLRFFAGSRKYGSTLEASLDANEVPVSVYHNLIEAVHGNLDKMYRYVALRKKLLGLDELHMYDVYRPIVGDADREIPFEEAKETVLEALGVLGEDYLAMLREGFENRWIDVYENKGKRGGAYSTDVSRPHPYVLLNYKNNLDSQFTLAHEMGHSLHSYLSSKNQPVCTSNYVIFVAEVASTCNEVLLMRHLLRKTTEPRERAYLINHFLDEFKGTVYRQTMFAEFELFMGQASERGETLTADLLCEKYLELNKLYFGPDMISDPGIALEWARIPHFFYDYYVFQYATGFSAAVALANRILEEGAPAVADYKRFLSGGCSTDPISLLKLAGVDMSTPAPVNEGLKLFGELITELESLL